MMAVVKNSSKYFFPFHVSYIMSDCHCRLNSQGKMTQTLRNLSLEVIVYFVGTAREFTAKFGTEGFHKLSYFGACEAKQT
jgi:hypothetical protein